MKICSKNSFCSMSFQVFMVLTGTQNFLALDQVLLISQTSHYPLLADAYTNVHRLLLSCDIKTLFVGKSCVFLLKSILYTNYLDDWCWFFDWYCDHYWHLKSSNKVDKHKHAKLQSLSKLQLKIKMVLWFFHKSCLFDRLASFIT